MKTFNINCPHCGTFFYAEILLKDNELPLHCPGCDIFIEYEEYIRLLPSGTATAVARINRPLTKETIPEIIYRPAKS